MFCFQVYRNGVFSLCGHFISLYGLNQVHKLPSSLYEWNFLLLWSFNIIALNGLDQVHNLPSILYEWSFLHLWSFHNLALLNGGFLALL